MCQPSCEGATPKRETRPPSKVCATTPSGPTFHIQGTPMARHKAGQKAWRAFLRELPQATHVHSRVPPLRESN